MLGRILGGRYKIIYLFGGGMFCRTYLAQDTHLPDYPWCVVKLLKPVMSNPFNRIDLKTAKRLFDAEAQQLYSLGKHDRIPQLLAHFEEDGDFYLVQEFIDGHDLSEEIKEENSFSEAQVIALLQDILETLSFLHERNIIHRDIKPSNLIRRRKDSRIVLIDFGAVKEIRTLTVPSRNQPTSTIAIGTPGYMPNEQSNGKPRFCSDIYALGIVGIQALTGCLPSEDPDTGEIIWHNQVKVSSELANILDKMVRYYFKQRYQSAAEVLQDIKAITSTVSVHLSSSNLSSFKIDYAQFWYKKGNVFKNHKHHEEAVALYDKAIQLKYNFPRAWFNKGIALKYLKKYQEAIKSYNKAIKISSNYYEAWFHRGIVLYELKQYEAAAFSSKQATEIMPKYPEAWFLRGLALYDLERYKESADAFVKATDLRKDYVEAWFRQGWAFHSSGENEKAIECYEQVIKYKTEYCSRAWYYKGLVLCKIKQYEAAINAFDCSIQIEPEFTAAWYQRGSALCELQCYEKAIASFDKVIKIEPSYPYAWVSRAQALMGLNLIPESLENYGRSFMQEKQYEKALIFYNLSIERSPDFFQGWKSKGLLFSKLKRYKEALESFEEAIRIKHDDAEVWFSKGSVLFELEQYEEAVASYEQAIQIKPDYQSAISARIKARRKLGFNY